MVSSELLATCFLGKNIYDDIIYYVSIILFWGYIAHKTNTLVCIDIPETPLFFNPNLKHKEEELEDEKDEFSFNSSFVELLNKTMEEDKLYLNPKLTIKDVANSIGTNRTYLSYYINNTLHTSFYDFINNYRIENSSKHLLLLINTTYTIEEIAEIGRAHV